MIDSFVGVGEEYVEFELGSETIVRLSAVHIFIPMMPLGPFSVRTMRLDGLDRDRDRGQRCWKPITPVLEVEYCNGWQRIVLERPIDAQFVRLVCLSNQASRLRANPNIRFTYFGISSVGIFTVKFE